jgi:hypothetical protein
LPVFSGVGERDGQDRHCPYGGFEIPKNS